MKDLHIISLLLLLLALPVFNACAEADEDEFAHLRQEMVSRQLEARDITDERVLEIMSQIPRHKFVPEAYRNRAYTDHPLPIGYDQTISQPYIVAYMTQALNLSGDEKVLEIGTGSGYQAAVLAELADSVFSIEIVPQLAERANNILEELGYANAKVVHGDGYKGWQREAIMFDRIILTAAPPKVPKALFDQLDEGGILVAPEGKGFQTLRRYTKTEEGGMKIENLLPVRFVPMIHGKD